MLDGDIAMPRSLDSAAEEQELSVRTRVAIKLDSTFLK